MKRPTCGYHYTFDPETGDPTGDDCGRPATAILCWRDGRKSFACAAHGVRALTDEGRAELVASLRIIPCRPKPASS